jgi:hypothetical protein
MNLRLDKAFVGLTHRHECLGPPKKDILAVM